MGRHPTDCRSAAASAAKTCQNANDLVREAVGCNGVLARNLDDALALNSGSLCSCRLSGGTKRVTHAPSSSPATFTRLAVTARTVTLIGYTYGPPPIRFHQMARSPGWN